MGIGDDRQSLNVEHGACCDTVTLFCIYSLSLLSYPIYFPHLTLLQTDELPTLLYVSGLIRTS